MMAGGQETINLDIQTEWTHLQYSMHSAVFLNSFWTWQKLMKMLLLERQIWKVLQTVRDETLIKVPSACR